MQRKSYSIEFKQQLIQEALKWEMPVRSQDAMELTVKCYPVGLVSRSKQDGKRQSRKPGK